MRFVGRGHPAVRASHTKTLELAPGSELTGRGTCIIAVDATAQPASPMAGPIRLRISAGGRHVTVRATANSSWDPGGTIVVRRGPLRLPGTFATDADTAAADLPRELVAALRDPDALITVDVVAVPDESPVVVLFAADPSRPIDLRLLAEYDAADAVERQDAGARALVPAKQGEGMRRLIIATTDLPRLDTEAAVEVVGLPAQLAVAAATPGRDPLAVVPAAQLRDSLRRLPAATCVATETTPPDLQAVLALAHDVRGTSRCVVAQPYGPLVRADVDTPPTLYGRDPVYVCFDSADRPGALDPAVRAAIAGLLAAGVATKAAAAALATLTGLQRRVAYDFVLTLSAERR